MLVFCKMGHCPYQDQRGFCAKQSIQIDENAMCTVMWHHGNQVDQRKWQIAGELVDKEPITLMDVEYKPIEEEMEDAEDQVMSSDEPVTAAIQDGINEQQEVEKEANEVESENAEGDKEGSVESSRGNIEDVLETVGKIEERKDEK